MSEMNLDEDDGELNELGETPEEYDARMDYMLENFPETFEEELSDSDKLEMMADDECSECGCTIDTTVDSRDGDLGACDSCGKEYRHCSTCSGYYDALLHICPNDH